MDTGNLSSSVCTAKDNYMATLLINGAGQFGMNGLYKMLKYKIHGSSSLEVEDILRKEFKKWTTSGLEKLGLLMVVSGYYDFQKKFKREILVSAASSKLMKNLLLFLNSDVSQLPLRILHQIGVKDRIRVFEIDKVTSRRTIERLLQDFISACNSS